MIRWIELVAQNPGSAIVLIVSTLSLVGYLAVLFSNVKHMQGAMVTKKDLTIALAEFREGLQIDLNGTYVRKRECELAMSNPGHVKLKEQE